MSELNDADLLSAYANQRSDQAFAELVERYLPLVYTAALRQLRNTHTAQDVAQAVFTILAQKAGTLKRHTTLAGWLCRTTHFVARNALRTDLRRQHREHEAHMQSLDNDQTGTDDWVQLAPLLDQAVAELSEPDRDAVVLRFYNRMPIDQIGGVFGISSDAAQKRIARAVEKLHKHFIKRGATFSTLGIIAAISANSVKAAPIGLATTIAPAAAKSAALGTTTTLVKGTLKLMAWTKLKTAAAIGIGILALTGAATVTIQKIKHPDYNPADFRATTYPTGDPAAMQYTTNSYGHPENYTFPISRAESCSVNGLLNQCMEVSGWHYLIDKDVAAGSVNFGCDKVMNGREWVSAFESALQTNTPEWWDQKLKKMRTENLVLIRKQKQKTILVVPKDKAAKYRS